MSRERRVTAVILAAGLASTALAAPPPGLPLVITADRSTAVSSPGSDQSTVTYEGHVVLTRGVAEIDGNTAIVYLVHQNLDRAQVMGTPATFAWRPKGQRTVTGSARQITYFMKQDEVVLVGNVRVQRGGERFAAAEVHYMLRSGTLTAQAGTSPKAERVHVVLPPASTSGPGKSPP